MNRHDNEPRYKKYDFNSEQDRRRQRRKQYSGWWFALLILIIAIGLAFSINWLMTRHSHQSNSSSTAAISKTIDKSKNAIEGRNSKGSLTKKVEDNRVSAFSSKIDDAKAGGLTPAERGQLQKSINNEQNKTVKNREQQLLNKANKQAPAKPKIPDPFATTHTFSSVNDAKNWANATKQQWLKDGYVNYTISSNGQGYYVLKFIK
ncbi:hypothetical protein KTE19_09545 [Lentilactobacillus sp. IMAU92037]|uniref:hypothetical protein n=1 Tax=Lentilactobacillus TaxID=2767893 RepID=UPI001C2C3BBB|nr:MULTISPECIES: hypothetical protein [Lentilactobacillus]MBV0930939.1 hypothetical protein [Lentilactobacillus dabitei]MDM7516637.1 hypothetical protein [Lentilactobacillus sp. TOM.63]